MNYNERRDMFRFMSDKKNPHELARASIVTSMWPTYSYPEPVRIYQI